MAGQHSALCLVLWECSNVSVHFRKQEMYFLCFGLALFVFILSLIWSFTLDVYLFQSYGASTAKNRDWKSEAPYFPATILTTTPHWPGTLSAVNEWYAPCLACLSVHCAATTRSPPSLNICHSQRVQSLSHCALQVVVGLVIFCSSVVGSGWPSGRGQFCDITWLYGSWVRCCWSTYQKSDNAVSVWAFWYVECWYFGIHNSYPCLGRLKTSAV